MENYLLTAYKASPPTIFDGQNSVLLSDSVGNLKITNGTNGAGEDLPNDVQKVETRWGSGLAGGPTSASILLKTGVGQFAGLICTASTAGIIRVWDSTTATGTKVWDSLTLVAGTSYFLPSYSFTIGCYFELVSGTCTVTPYLR